MSEKIKIPPPSKGTTTVFKVDDKMFVQMNKDGWVEEIGYGSKENDGSILLEGMPGTGLDDLLANRYYDLYTRMVLLDVHSGKQSIDKSGGYACIPFKDLEPGSPMYDRVQTCIAISNHYFETNLTPLS